MSAAIPATVPNKIIRRWTMYVKYVMEDPPATDGDKERTYHKIRYLCNKILDSWMYGDAIVYHVEISSEEDHQKLLTTFPQEIGPFHQRRKLTRFPICKNDFKKWIQNQTEDSQDSDDSDAPTSRTPPAKKICQEQSSKTDQEKESNHPEKMDDQTSLPHEYQPDSKVAETTTKETETPSIEQESPSLPTKGTEEMPFKTVPFKPRRHPAKAKLQYVPHQKQVTCLLFRPTTANSLHTADKKTIALGFQALPVKPVAIRKIKDGGFAADFLATQDTENLLTVSHLGGIPVTVLPPTTRIGSSGIIRPDCLTTAEVHELYAIHEENPPLVKVTKLGDRPVFKLDFVGNCPESVRIFHNTVPVESYFRQPVRCYKCSRYGHFAASCQSTAACSLCASAEHSHKDCPKQSIKCVNCGGPHPAISKACPHRLFWLSTAKVAAKKKITFQEARIETTKSYAEALKRPQKTDSPSPTMEAAPNQNQDTAATEISAPASQSSPQTRLLLSILEKFLTTQQPSSEVLQKAIQLLTVNMQ